MKFATTFPSEDALANAISKYRTWFRIKQEALTTTPREKKPSTISPLARLLDRFLEFDQAELLPEDDAVLTQWEAEFHKHIRRLRKGMKCLDVTAPRLTRKQRFPGGAQLAGDLFHLLQAPGEHDPHVVEETARQAFAYECDVEGTSVDDPSSAAVQQFKTEFSKVVEKQEGRDSYVPGEPIWETAASEAAREVLAAGIR